MSDSGPVEFTLWHYTPSKAGGIVAAIVFILLTGYHAFRLIQCRTWFCIPFIIGGLFETIGYAARAAASSDTETITPYVIQSILILIAPVLFAGSIYMILGRLIRATGGQAYSLIRVNWVTKIFVAGDVFCFMMQSTGGGLLAKAEDQDDVDLGEKIILGGLVLQILIFGFFVLIAAIFHKRMNRHQTHESLTAPFSWQRLMLALYLVSALITVRNFCRVVEYAMGRDGYLIQHEWPLYIYDCLLMITTLAVCTTWYIPEISKSRPKSEGTMPMNLLSERSVRRR